MPQGGAVIAVSHDALRDLRCDARTGQVRPERCSHCMEIDHSPLGILRDDARLGSLPALADHDGIAFSVSDDLLACNPGAEEKQKELEPIFRRYGVDVVFSGHNHFYERSKPIHGILYVTAGTGGARLSNIKGKKPFSAAQISEYGFVGVTLSPTSLLLEFIDDQGRVRDRHVIKKGAPGVGAQKL